MPKPINKKGQVVIAISIMILAVLIGSSSIISYIKTNSDAIRRLNNIKESAYLAEAGIAKTVWCLNHDTDADCGGTAGSSYPGESSIAIGNGIFTTTVTDNGQNKIILSTGTTNNGVERIIKVESFASPETTDASFTFGAHVGGGGIEMGNNSMILGVGGTFGNVYSHGNIECGNNSGISGTAKVAGSGNKIDGCDIGYDGSGNLINDNADAWAQTLINCRVAHDTYHPLSGSNNCLYGLGSQGGTLYNDSTLPPILAFPITGQMITNWKTEASAGNGGVPIIGDYTPTNGETLGPIKIEGDLELNNNVTLNVGGTIWVEGDIILNNNAKLKLLSSFGPNSAVVIADNPSDQSGSGKVELQNNSSVEGSGDPDSYIMLLSTNTSNDAIDLMNNSEGAIYATTQGTIRLSNNALVKEVIAYKLEMGNNATLTYETGLIDVNFASGPSGAWRIKRETWQIIN